MKMKVVTTITSILDVNTMETDTQVDISDEDGVSEVSKQVLGSLLIGSLRSTERAVREQFHIPEKIGRQPITTDEED